MVSRSRSSSHQESMTYSPCWVHYPTVTTDNKALATDLVQVPVHLQRVVDTALHAPHLLTAPCDGSSTASLARWVVDHKDCLTRLLLLDIPSPRPALARGAVRWPVGPRNNQPHMPTSITLPCINLNPRHCINHSRVRCTRAMGECQDRFSVRPPRKRARETTPAS